MWVLWFEVYNILELVPSSSIHDGEINTIPYMEL